MQLAQKQAEYEQNLKQSEEFHKEQERKREERKAKNMMHVQDIKDQMRELPRTFAKTGIAIIKQWYLL